MSNKFFSNNFDTSDSSSDNDSDDNINKNIKENKQSKKINKSYEENSSDDEYGDNNKNNEDDNNSDDSNSDNSNSDNSKETLRQIDKLITLRYIRDGKASRTYLDGLEFFFTNEEELNKLIKDIQKKLSTGYFKNKENNNHGFNGDHRLKISRLLINTYKIAKEKIKIC